jgi:Flp pilus assembly protein TadD
MRRRLAARRANVLDRLGVRQRLRGHYLQAVALHREPVALRGNAPGRASDLAALHINLGVAYKYAGLFEEAERAYRRARDLVGRHRDL